MCVLLFSEKDDSKVDAVCDAVLACLDQLYSTQSHFLLATITALVKKTTPQLEIVLTKIKQLQGFCVCVCVCLSVCLCVCVSMCLCVFVHLRTCVLACACLYERWYY